MNMKLRNIPFSPPDMTEAEAALVREAILSGWITTGPKTKEFEDLWPSKDVIKRCDRKNRHGKVSVTPVRVYILTAQRKLDILCRLVAKEITGNVSQGDSQADINIDDSIQPLTEKEFARRIHRIFEELNMAWNSRKDKTFIIKFHAFQRRRCFSPMFMPGILVK